MRSNEKLTCPICRRENALGKICLSCESPVIFLDGLATVFSFTEQKLLLKCIYSFKYDFIEELALPLGEMLFQTLEKFIFQPEFKIFTEKIILCPVPLHSKRLRFRGFNQSELLALQTLRKLKSSQNDEAIAEISMVHCLRRIHFSKPQMELQREERLTNVIGAFDLEEKQKDVVAESTIFLVDDVATTLSTLNACAEVLKKAGAKAVFGLVLAHGLQK